MAREMAYKTCSEGGMNKTLKESKKAIWPQFPISCGVFSLNELGHAFREVDNMLSLRLPKFPGRQYDPFGIVKDFTTMVKVKIFSHEKDPFDDVFLQKNTFREVKHMAQILLDREDLETFYSYREKRLSKVPLDQLLIEPIREPTPSVSIEGDSKEKFKTNSGKASEKSSENEKSRSRESI